MFHPDASRFCGQPCMELRVPRKVCTPCTHLLSSRARRSYSQQVRPGILLPPSNRVSKPSLHSVDGFALPKDMRRPSAFVFHSTSKPDPDLTTRVKRGRCHLDGGETLFARRRCFRRKRFVAMTEYWVSKGRHYCELCNAWMADTQMAIRAHENGAKHKQMVAKKIQQAREDGLKQEREAKMAQKSMDRVEELAKKQYEKDVQEARRVAGDVSRGGPTCSLGAGWRYDDRCGYYYDDASGYYYDPESKMYYKDGAWSKLQEQPSAALSGRQAPLPSTKATKKSSHTPITCTTEYASGYGTLHPAYEASLRRKAPETTTPGHQPNMGSVGASRGVAPNTAAVGKKKQSAAPQAGPVKKQKLSREEAEAVAKREAARKRVEARTLSSLGLQ